MKKILLLFVLIIASCNLKNNDVTNDKIVDDTVKTNNVDIKEEPNEAIFTVNNIYSECDYNYLQMLVNYNSEKFIYNDEFEKCLVDTTLVKTKNLELFDVLQNPKDHPDEAILIDNFTLATLKYNGNLYIGLFKMMDIDKYKCLDVLLLDQYKTKESYFDLGNNKLFSYSCETDKGHSCYAIVIDKVNSKGKYDKILKAIKFDLPNKKVVEIDLKKEKIECFPEMSDE